MKNIKKNVLKIVVLIALSAPAAFADGDMPGGGLASNGDGTKSGEVVTAEVTEDSSAGLTGTDAVNSFLSAIYEYFDSMV